MGQRPIAIHAKENLGTTDEGVAMWRKICRDALRGKTPHAYPKRANGNGGDSDPMTSYCQDTLFNIPELDDLKADREMMREVGRQVTAIVFDGDQFALKDRKREIRKRLKALEKEFQKAYG